MPAFFDSQFKTRRFAYLFQALMAGLVIVIALSVMSTVKQTALLAAMGASAFIAFTMPHQARSGARPMIGGYVVGIICGVAVSGFSDMLCPSVFELSPRVVAALAGGIAVAASTFLMVVTDAEHPPAAGVALGLVLNEWDHWTILVMLGGITTLYAAKRLLRRYMSDLL